MVTGCCAWKDFFLRDYVVYTFLLIHFFFFLFGRGRPAVRLCLLDVAQIVQFHGVRVRREPGGARRGLRFPRGVSGASGRAGSAAGGETEAGEDQQNDRGEDDMTAGAIFHDVSPSFGPQGAAVFYRVYSMRFLHICKTQETFFSSYPGVFGAARQTCVRPRFLCYNTNRYGRDRDHIEKTKMAHRAVRGIEHCRDRMDRRARIPRRTGRRAHLGAHGPLAVSDSRCALHGRLTGCGDREIHGHYEEDLRFRPPEALCADGPSGPLLR